MNLSIIIKIKYFDKHLDDCINSLLTQNLQNYEIILVSKKHNTQIDVFLLNILNKYSQKLNLIVVQEETENFNEILNSAIKIAKGKYVHIVNQNTLILEDTYHEFFKVKEVFNYDVIVLDYIKIIEDIPFSEVCKRYNKSIIKEKNKIVSNQYSKDLLESGLVFDFDKYSKDNNNKLFKKAKGLKYYSSNFFESIQRLDPEYKIKLLYNIDVQEYNIVFKRELFSENTFIFSDLIETKLDIYLRLLLIKNITCIKNTAICSYNTQLTKSKKEIKETKEINKIKEINEINKKYSIDLENIIQNNKRRYKQIIDLYKKNPKAYASSFELIEYLIFNEILNFEINEYNLNPIDKQKYLKEIFSYLEEILPNYKENKYLNKSIYEKIKITNKINKLQRYLNQDLISNVKIKNKSEEKNKNKNKTENKDKNKIEKADKHKIEKRNEKQKQKEKIKETVNKKKSKIKNNFFKVIYRRIKVEFNKIKRTRLNQNIIQNLKVFKIKIKELLLKIQVKIKNLFVKIFKRKEEKKLQISDNKVLLLNPGSSESKKEIIKESLKTKQITKFKQEKEIRILKKQKEIGTFKQQKQNKNKINKIKN